MELVDGLCLASFADAGAAVGWALSAQADLMEQVRDMGEDMLSHFSGLWVSALWARRQAV